MAKVVFAGIFHFLPMRIPSLPTASARTEMVFSPGCESFAAGTFTHHSVRNTRVSTTMRVCGLSFNSSRPALTILIVHRARARVDESYALILYVFLSSKGKMSFLTGI